MHVIIIKGDDFMRKKLLSFMILFFGLLFSFSGVFALNSETDLYEKIYYHESDIVFRVYEKEDGLYYQSQKEIIFENKDQIEGFYKIEGDIYFLSIKDKRVFTTPVTVDGKTYYFDEHGVMEKEYQNNVFESDSEIKENGVSDSIKENVATGFIKEGNYVYYINSNGEKAKWLQQINGKMYYFNGQGVLYNKGWLTFNDGTTRYFGTDGACVIGFNVIGGKTYYFDENGIMYKWLKTIDGVRYYFNGQGIMHRGWLDFDGTRHYFNNRGEEVKGFFVIDGKTYYFDEHGNMLKWLKTIDGKIYYFNGQGVMHKGWLYSNDGTTRYFGTDGAALIGFTTISGKTYYFDKDGVMYKWLKTIDEKTYYFNGEGVMYRGWLKFNDGSTRYFDNNGVMSTYLTTIDGKYYYFSSNGSRITGWQTINNQKYYFTKDGYALVGKQQVKDTVYLFSGTGVLQNSFETVNGVTYYKDGNGRKLTDWHWVEGKKYYFNKNGEMLKANAKKIIDVSYWQYAIDWDRVHRDGDIDGAILRIGYTATATKVKNVDSYFANNLKGVQKYGIPFGVYYYGYATNKKEALEEANLVIKTLNGTKLNFPIYYDAEESKITKAQYEEVIPAFIEAVTKAGYKAGVYGNYNALTYTYLNSPIIKKYPIWVAQYNTTCDYAGNYVMWQYTSSGKIPGINGNVDMNVMS